MDRYHSRLASLLILGLVTAAIAHAQVATGIPPFSSTGGGPDIVNEANLNVHLSVPVIQKAGRGLPFSYILSYDSSIWMPAASAWTPYSWGWRGVTEAQTGYTTYKSTNGVCNVGYSYYYWISFDTFVYHDPVGTAHPFNIAVSTWTPGWPCGSGGPSTATGISTDSAGYTLTVTANANWTLTVNSLKTKSGYSITAPLQTPTGSGTLTDSNGNKVNTDGTNFYDTLNGSSWALNVTGSGTPASPKLYKYLNSAGTAKTVTVNYTAYTIKTNFGCGGISEYGPTAINLVSSIVLPDSTSYTFTYETTPGYPSYKTGRIASITLPTGGSITYAYTGLNNGIVCADGSTRGMNRTLAGGQWTYTRTQVSGAHWQTSVTSPASTVTTIDFWGLYETKRVVGSLLTVDTCYNNNLTNCTITAVTAPISRRTITQSISVGATTLKSKRDEYYDPYGQPFEFDEYAFGSGVVGSLVRKTLISYAALGNGIKDRPISVEVQDGSAAAKSRTTYTYSNTVTSIAGTPQWVSVSGDRGNATRITLTTAFTPSVTTIWKDISYYETGMVNTASDFKSNVTTFSYAGSSCGNAFPTSVSMPLSLSTSATWNCYGAVATSGTDLNGQSSSVSYDDLWRVTQATSPGGSQSDVDYSTLLQPTVTTKLATSLNRVDKSILDTYGRVSINRLDSDPEGATEAKTEYDTSGRVLRVSNPYRGGTPSEWETLAYDGLNRVTSVTHPDSSLQVTAYGSAAGGTQSCSTLGYPTLVTDEAGKKRRTYTDALGRVVEVQELNTDGTLLYSTCYSYDTLNNLSGVTQGAQTRTYAYDPLGRVTSATTPEEGPAGSATGTTNFYYTTSGGALCSGDPNAVCRKTDARSITTTFTYDALNRLTGKSFSDSTPAVTYSYDGAGCLGLATCHNIGKRTGMADGQGSASWAYSETLRKVVQQRTTNSVTETVTYEYTEGGLLSALTYPSGRKVDYTYSAAGRPIVAKDNANSINYALNALYSPHGALASSLTGQSGGFGGVTASATFNNRLWPSTLQATSSNGTVLNLTYAYFGNGNVSTITNNLATGRTQTFTYDYLNRILTAQSQATSGSDCWGQSFGYDSTYSTNLSTITTTKTDPSCVQTGLSLSITNKNRFSGTNVTFDNAGNLTNDGVGSTYAWNAENRMTAAGALINYGYDGDGQRVKDDSAYGGAYDKLHWYGLGGEELAETYFSGANMREWIYFGGARIARREDDGTVNYFFADHLGTARVMTSPTGVTWQESTYYPFGGEQRVITNNSDNRYKFAGMYRDPTTGLDHTWARDYPSNLARWLSPDPMAGSILNPQSLNRYAYVMNNPVNFTDPLGLCDPRYCYPGYPGIPPGGWGSQDVPPSSGFAESWSGFGGHGGGGGAYIGGSEVSHGFFAGVVSMGIATACPNNSCTNIKYTTDGQLQEWVSGGQRIYTLTDPDTGADVGSFAGEVIKGYWSTIARAGDAFNSGLRFGGNFASGAADFLTLRGTAWDGPQQHADVVNVKSGAYAGGFVTGLGITAATGALAAGEIVAGLETRIAIHMGKHVFPLLGEVPHVQIIWYVVGIKGSDQAIRIPVPWWPGR